MKTRVSYSAVVSTLALFIAISTGGAYAIDKIGSKQIQNGSIRTADLHKGAVKSAKIGPGAVKSADIGNEAVQTADIGTGQVTPQDVTMPAPAQLQETSETSVTVGNDFVLVDAVGTYDKQDSASVLEVNWTGTASFNFGGSGCLFQLRIDGQSSANGGGTVFVPGTESVSVTAIFAGFATGTHTIEVWARQTPQGSGSASCTFAPANAGISQTFVVSEQVV